MSRKFKGEWGYINYQRKRVMLITLVLYVCAIGIYLFGYLSLNTTKNLFSVIGVLGILPASKSMVNLIMFLRFKSLPEEIHRSFEEVSGDDGLCIIFETPFTTYEKTYFVEAIACRNKTVVCSYPEGSVSGNTLKGSRSDENVRMSGNKGSVKRKMAEKGNDMLLFRFVILGTLLIFSEPWALHM